MYNIKVFKNGPNKIWERQSLINLKWHCMLWQAVSLQFLKGCFSQILLGPFLNILTLYKVFSFSRKCENESWKIRYIDSMLSFENILKRLTADDREKNCIPKSGRAIPKKYCSFIQNRDESINSMVTKLYLTLATQDVTQM